MPDEQQDQPHTPPAQGERTKSEDLQTGIWLEVTDVRYESGKNCTVLLKGDREHPKPIWRPVEKAALGKSGDDDALENYKAILDQLDKKRNVLAWLTCSDASDHSLHCKFLRFQSPDSVSR